MNILIIGNPIASGGDGEKKICELQSILENRGHTVEPYLTQYAGDGKERISQVTSEVDRVVIVGGDGTVNEIINGIPQGFSIPIIQMPMGNANLLAHDLDLPESAVKVADILEKGRVVMADVAKMNNDSFIMVAGAGFDARVTEEVKKIRRGRVSNLSYIMPIFRALINPAHSRFDVVVDGAKCTRGAMVLVCNVRNYGGICDIAFDAGVDTRVLDIIVFPHMNLLSLLRYGVYAKFSRVTRLRGVKYFKGKIVDIDSVTPIPVELDGDFKGWHSHVSIQLESGCVPLLIP
ncbi:lipid kinase, YegS/Rv2252/BmrU family [Desulfocicer vacuolatum DSM 3385]|uniref:Lipid kinase, YegS/Rv2252/BmrU family n=1 Tax=Desulfocicer vacuolatum DSM 3385 TaxID=1121400 RepID=A0A1W2CY97_9BACT|nr:YegS/Rv2252/BmrU family lipid kinase [Desulfocicer vacuolatum]SMC90239.1 lipid kinase, YegS/Rv2252/BmrU family [Desulfocicer vacuolatum DSM 3385]